MTTSGSSKDAEFAAMQVVYEALVSLEDEAARARVIAYIIDRLDIHVSGKSPARRPAEGNNGGEETSDLREEQASAPKYGVFAELYDAARPETQADKALVAGYWLQLCEGNDSFDGFSANKLLKDLGHGLENITVPFKSLKSQAPSLVLQLRKSGTTRQARKTYKLSLAGVKEVERLISQHGRES